LRLRRFVECPHAASVERSRFRLVGPPSALSAAWMSSRVSKVGLARLRANRGCGTRPATVNAAEEVGHTYIRNFVRPRVPVRRKSRRIAHASSAPARARHMARIVLATTLGVQRGESVAIETWTEGLPWAHEFVREAYRLGARPCLLHRDEDAFYGALDETGDASAVTYGPMEWAIFERADAYVSLAGPASLDRTSELDRRAGKELEAQEERKRSIAARNGIRSAVLFLGRISADTAHHFGLSARSWTSEVVAASLVDPERMTRWGRAIAQRLRDAETIDLHHPNGTRLTLRLKRREPFVCAGIVGGADPSSEFRAASFPLETPIPAGFVSTAVDEEFAEGVVRSNVPGEQSEQSVGRSKGAHWEFSEGRLVHGTFERGQAEFDAAFARGGPGRDRPGFLTVGLNPQIRRAPWMVDQGLGTVTVGIGANGHLGGTTRVRFHSAIYLAGADLRVGERPLLRRGKLV
jgi:leucyl aminopeptidase (aminopeptidase T)